MGEIPRVHQVDPQPRLGAPVHRVADAGDRRGSRRQDGKAETSSDSVELDELDEPVPVESREQDDPQEPDAPLDIVA